MQPCPIDCVVGEWSDYGMCSAPCGGGVRLPTVGHAHLLDVITMVRVVCTRKEATDLAAYAFHASYSSGCDFLNSPLFFFEVFHFRKDA